MKRTSNFFHILLLICSVFGADADEMKAVSVFEGESVTLNPDKDIQGIFLVLWRFGDKGSTIAQFIDKEIYYPNHTGIFRERLKLNETGSLTISNMRAKHSGHYNLQIDGRELLKMKFIVTVNEPPLVIGDHKAEIKSVSVKEGYHVSLFTDVTELHGDELIVWRFGDEEKLMAKDDKETKSTRFYDTDERFRHRLELNDQTGSLTIKHAKDTDAGLYTVTINGNKNILYKKFIVTVSGSGLSSGAVAGIVVMLLVLVAVAAVLGFLYYRNKISELQKQIGKKINTAKGENVTLKTETKLLEGDEIQWWFSNNNFLIAEIFEGIGETYGGPRERFSNCLELDKETGSLTIKNIKWEHTGDYRLEIIKRSGGTSNSKFIVCFKEEKMLVSRGQSVTLKADAEIQREDEVQWMFKVQNDLIAKMTGNTRKIIYPDERFSDTLKMDEKTGSLTINNIEPEHTGLYKLKIISRGEATYKTFTVYFHEIIPKKYIIDGRIDESVTLNPDIEIQRNNEIQWMIGDQDCLIAKMTRGARKITYHDERFRDRLVLNEKTGSLTINNITIEDNRDYKLRIISSSGTTENKFSVLIKGKPSFFCEGDRAVLQCAAEIQTDEIEWRFEGEESPIAEVEGGQIVPYNGPNWRFRDRLEVDKSNGSLTIKNIRREHEGLYQLKRKSSGTADSFYAFTVTVYDSIIVGWVGKSVTLKSDTEIQRNYEILWLIEDRLIAKLTREAREITYLDERFRDRLVLDEETGSLTINNITVEDNRAYKMRIISSSGTTEKKFGVLIKGVPMSFNEGDRAVLQCAADIQTDEIEWRFKSVESPIAEVKGGQIIPYNGPDRRFKDGLKIDEKTGSLIISNIRREHEGLYQLMKKSSSTGHNISAFDVMVYGSTGNQVNDSVTEESPLLYEDDQNVVYENERMSSL